MTQPQFEAEELFQAIEMDKGTTFIVVEGAEVDVFDSALRGLLNKKGVNESGWVVGSGSDKFSILGFLTTTKASNVYAILDHDFTGAVHDLARVTYLDRYSIENYLFDEMVVKQTSARLYRKASNQIALETSELVAHYQESFAELLCVLKQYQTANIERNVAWTDKSVLVKDCWQADMEYVAELIEAIADDFPHKPLAKHAEGDVLREFPAKLLVKGIYQYIRKNARPPGFTKVFNNEKAFLFALLGNIEHSRDFLRCLDGAKQFIAERALDRIVDKMPGA